MERDHERRLRLALRNRRQRELYGPKHIRRRREFARRLERGEPIICPRCDDLIGPDQLWDLGHDDRDPSWTRPEHRSCNRATSGRRRAMPLRWSRRWFDDPAVGTEVTLGGGLVEIYIGRGIMAEVRERGRRRNAPLSMRPCPVPEP